MTRLANVHRPEFTVQCTCGVAYHTSDDHIGKELRCRCGRTVAVVRPRAEMPEPPRESRARHQKKKQRARLVTSGPELLLHGSWWQRTKYRTSVWLASMLRPLVFGHPVARVSAALAWAYLLTVLVAWVLLDFGSELFVPGTIMAYGPRFMLLLPLVLLVPLSAKMARATLWPLVFGAWVVLDPIMGARLAPIALAERALPSAAPSNTFRIVTFNSQEGGRLARDLSALLHDQAPDIVAFQECGDVLWQSLQAQPGWHSVRHNALCTASRWPISQADSMTYSDIERVSLQGYSGNGAAMRAFIDTPHGPLIFVNVHLGTARRGFNALMGAGGFAASKPLEFVTEDDDVSEELPEGPTPITELFRNAANLRETEAERTSIWSAQGIENVPTVIAGDFNMPVESTIFQEFWGKFTDAFEEVGNGFGWSRHDGVWFHSRIDHVLLNEAGPKPVRAFLGPNFASEHLPVIVDLAWPAARR